MNIALFTDTYLPDINGVATSTHILRNELVKHGHHVLVVTTILPHDSHYKDENQYVLRLPGLDLKKLYEDSVSENNKKFVGTIQNVLVEGKSKNNENTLTGRTESNKVVNFEGDESLIGNMVKIKIISEHMWYLKGSCDKI